MTAIAIPLALSLSKGFVPPAAQAKAEPNRSQDPTRNPFALSLPVLSGAEGSKGFVAPAAQAKAEPYPSQDHSRNPFALSLSKPVLSPVEGGFVAPAAQAKAERSRSLSPRSNAHVRWRSSHPVPLRAPE